MLTRETIENALGEYVLGSKENFISAEMAMDEKDIGQHMYDAPIIAVGSADDPLWEQIKQPQAVGPLFRTPKEWMPGAKTVVSYFAPFSEYVRTGNEADPVEIGNGWLYARVDGQKFLNGVNHFLENFVREAGYNAYSPYASEEFRSVFSAGSKPDIDPALSYTSNWSERHVAFICGLGTFGLSKGLITRKGVSGRFGSIITDCELVTDVRSYTGIYDYCTMCGACANNCPAHAISIQEGKKHPPCERYVNAMGKKYAPRYGCGKCQVNTPCERGIPNEKFR